MFRLACAAPNCLMRTYNFTKEQSKLVKNNYTVSFHKFPRDADHRLAWITAAKKPDWNPSTDESLCSLHFGDDCFDQASQLYDHAVPTIFFEDFRSHIKNLAKTIDLEVDLESSDENEDILSKSLKSIGPLVPDDSDDSDQIVECEITISDDDEDEVVSPSVNSQKGESTSSQPVIMETIEKKSDAETKKSATSTTSSATSNYTKTPTSSYASTMPEKVIASKDMMQKLYSMVKNDSLKKNLMVEPTTQDFVFQLLNIVKMANLQNASIDSSVPNTYLITTRQENKNIENQEQNVISMETSDIISLITRTVKMIKKGEFRKSNLLTIICASPAIFLIKNVTVKSFDTNMNSVYVVTSEDLIKSLALVNEKMVKDQAMKLTSHTPTTSSTPSRAALGHHRFEVNAASANRTRSVSAQAATSQSKNVSGQTTISQSPKSSSGVTPLRSLKPKPSITSLEKDASAFKNVKIDLKSIKADNTVVQSLKNLNLTGVPTLLQNVGSPRQNVLKLNIASPLPGVLAPGSNRSNVIHLKLASPIAVPKGAVYCAENSEKDKSASNSVALAKESMEDKQAEPPAAKKPAIDPAAYLKNQRREIERLENDILSQEREIGLLRRKVLVLKKRHLAVKNPSDTKSDERVIEEILNKYFDQDAMQFFISQMKVSGKTYTQFRWSEEDKLFALGLLYKHPMEYNILFQKFTLPSDKTLSKFVSKIKKAEKDVKSKKS